MEKSSKFFTRLILLGAVVGGALTSWLSPKVIAWYFEPPVNIGINCREATEWAMKKLQIAQTTGIIAGGVFGLVIAILWRAKKSAERKTLPQ